MEGKGTFTWSDGRCYVGEYQNDQKPKPPRRNMYDLKCSVFFTYGCFNKNN